MKKLSQKIIRKWLYKYHFSSEYINMVSISSTCVKMRVPTITHMVRKSQNQTIYAQVSKTRASKVYYMKEIKIMGII